eukprot:Tbor_TRINITY_DN3643_c0_g1::TRINITY_DN3643_c0_g1_i1::g.309::m.309
MLRDLLQEWYLQVIDSKELLHPSASITSQSVTSSDISNSEIRSDYESRTGLDGDEFHRRHKNMQLEADPYTFVISSSVTYHVDEKGSEIGDGITIIPSDRSEEVVHQEGKKQNTNVILQSMGSSMPILRTFASIPLSPSRLVSCAPISSVQPQSFGLIAEVYISHDNDYSCPGNGTVSDNQFSTTSNIERLVVFFDRTRGFARVQEREIEETDTLREADSVDNIENKQIEEMKVGTSFQGVENCQVDGKSGFYCLWRCSSCFHETLFSLLLSTAMCSNRTTYLPSRSENDIDKFSDNYEGIKSCDSRGSNKFMDLLVNALKKEVAGEGKKDT